MSTPEPASVHDRIEHKKLDRALVGGFAWTAGAKWISQAVSWPSVLITARLLSPSDYGLVELAGFYFIITNVMAEFGIGMAVLQMRELDASITAQLNTLAAMSGALAFCLSVALAPLIAAFFRAPALHVLVIVSSLSFILTSLEAIPLGLIQRDMDYRRLSITESVQALLTAVVSVACAYAGMGYWSLIAGNLIGRAGNISLAVYWRPVGYKWPRFREVAGPLRYGMETAVQRVVWAINALSDTLIIGRTMGPVPVGAYRLASNLASTPADKVGALIMRVTGPLFSRVQHDRELMLRYFLIFSETLAMSVFPLLIGLAIVAPETVNLLLKSKWDGAIAPLRWLAIFVPIRTLSYLVGQLLNTLRLTRFGMTMSLITFAVMPVAFYVASRWGVGAVAAAWLIMAPINTLPLFIKVCRSIHCGVLEYLNALLPAIVGSAVMLVTILLFRSRVQTHGWKGLLSEVTIGGLAYGVTLWGFYRDRVMRFVRFFASFRKRPEEAATVA
ncbi:MAG TPA: lipopolysaccharide biosynthesis protein [Bryobacteraceae bacterium]|jgi:PST family polysaccharide transporter|nr:lipopolysaccharide biosynthesis protein [Bryobacteraceae bacterium]